MLHSELRAKFILFFQDNGHLPLASAGLVPADGTTQFTSAGMQALTPYLNGTSEPPHVRLTNSQKCLRSNDLEEVGDDTHLTFFEMLGSWSIGDYSKKDAIKFAHDFLTGKDQLAIPKDRLWVTVFEGDENQNVPRDDEAAKIWEDIGMPHDRIAYLPAEDNWWSAGDEGLCGPDTEIFYDTKLDELGPVPEGQNPGNDPDNRFVEIWNSVFMSYDRKPDGSLESLPAQNVDQGAGLERLLAVINGTTVYETSCFKEVIDLLKSGQGKETDHDERSLRIIADHMRSALFILSEEPRIYPSAHNQGSVLRRLIRNAAEQARELRIPSEVLAKTMEINADLYDDHYPEVRENLAGKIKIFNDEHAKFQKILDKAPGLVERFASAAEHPEVIPGEIAHTLHETHGIPVEVTQREARESGRVVDMEAYKAAVEAHKETSRGTKVQHATHG